MTLPRSLSGIRNHNLLTLPFEMLRAATKSEVKTGLTSICCLRKPQHPFLQPMRGFSSCFLTTSARLGLSGTA
jgi:hypothetical protein